MGRAGGGVRRGGSRADRGPARPTLPGQRRPRQLQAPAALRLRCGDSEDGLGQDPSPAAARWPVHGGAAMSEFLRVERAGAVATIWIDRQAKMNTMTVAMRNEFPGIFASLERDGSVRVVVIRGAGGDVSEFLTLAPADLELWGDTLTAAERCRKPVIAAIDGYTMGAGLELAV